MPVCVEPHVTICRCGIAMKNPSLTGGACGITCMTALFCTGSQMKSGWNGTWLTETDADAIAPVAGSEKVTVPAMVCGPAVALA